MSKNAGLRVNGEMEAAMALMQMSSDPPDWSQHKLTSAQSDSTSATENCETQTDNTDNTYEVAVVPSTSNHAPARVSLDVKVKVAAGSSNHQSYGVGDSNAPSSAPKFENIPNGDLINWKDNDSDYEEFPALPEATRLGKCSTNGFEEDFVNNEGTKIKTRDVGTQTDYYDDPCEKLLERVVKLRARKKELEAQLKLIQERRALRRTNHSNSEGDSYTPSDSGSPMSKYIGRRRSSRSTSSNNSRQSFESNEDVEFKSEKVSDIDENDDDDDEENSPNPAKRKTNVTMVPIGYGNAKVPLSLIKHMDWTSYSYATRKLLTAVFPRKILATHSLSGKPSPAFPGKKAKTQLDPDLVNDIVMTVMEKCDISEGRIRTSITTKCADESKMYRNRIKNRKRRLRAKKENLDPHLSPPPCHPSDALLPLNLSIKNN